MYETELNKCTKALDKWPPAMARNGLMCVAFHIGLLLEQITEIEATTEEMTIADSINCLKDEREAIIEHNTRHALPGSGYDDRLLAMDNGMAAGFFFAIKAIEQIRDRPDLLEILRAKHPTEEADSEIQTP